jgi:hypothetical protein
MALIVIAARPSARLLPLVAALLVVLPAPAPAQRPGLNPFRVTHNVEPAGATHVRITGQVTNEVPLDFVDVYVTAEALDAAGKRVAQGIAWVGGVRARASAEFSLRVPAVRGVASYRVGVTSFQALGQLESP